MRPVSFPGTYIDATGSELITWHLGPPDRSGYGGSYEISARIRGIDVRGVDFDGLEPLNIDPEIAHAALRLNATGEISECILTGMLPCKAETAGQSVPIVVRFELDLRHDPDHPHGRPRSLTLTTGINGTAYAVVDDWFEDGTLRLDQALRPDWLRRCVTCLYSDYSPAGHGLMGIRCHRDAKDQYLTVSSKADYWSVPVTEVVPETYLCNQYRIRIPGTGYRG
jgi:Family of unknown function (DUF6304)